MTNTLTPAARAALAVAQRAALTPASVHSLPDTIVFALDSAGLLREPGTATPSEASAEPRCARCGCTEDRACDGGCHWVATPLMQDLCSSCVRSDGSCPTPGCGLGADELDDGDPTVWGWVLLRVAGSETPARWLCSPWCVMTAMEAEAAELWEIADQAKEAGE